MKSIRKVLTGAVVLAASLGVGSAFAPGEAAAAKACWQFQKIYEHNITWDYWTERCDGVCENAQEIGACCAPCSS